MSETPTLPRPLYPAEMRVLGTLIEKSLTTPDAYPLTPNSVRVGCNQKTSRDPVSDYSDSTVQTAIAGLRLLELLREFLPADSRVVKIEHRMGLRLDLRNSQVALLAILMLRGPQTAGELRLNTQRLHDFDTVDAITDVLDRLSRREPALVRKIERGPGQREDRYIQLFGDEQTEADRATALGHAAHSSAPARHEPSAELIARIEALEARVAQLEAAPRPLTD